MTAALKYSVALAFLSLPATAIGQTSRVEQLNSTDPKNLASEAPYAITWKTTSESNIGWKCRMWRTIDFRDEVNRSYTSPERAAAILEVGALKGAFKMYSARGVNNNPDDRFTYKISRDSVRKLITSDKAAHPDDPIVRVMIKQDWLYLNEEQMLVGRIIGIAPVRTVVASDGSTRDEPLYWVYYTGARPFLREQQLHGGKNPLVQNFDQAFENMIFSGTIDSVQKSFPETSSVR